MAVTSSIRIVKEFTYRGQTRHFSNRYHFGTYLPPDATHWTTLMDAVTAAEKLIYAAEAFGGAKIIQGVGYAGGSEVPVFTKTYSLDGTFSPPSGIPIPGDCAAIVRYSTPDRSVKNHPIYCFNYYHSMYGGGSVATKDSLYSGQLTVLQTYAAAWLTGFSDGTTTVHRSRPSGDLCTGSLVNPLVTHRDLPH